MKRKIELLAPAKNLACAREVILHGADAVYIGAPKFGARAAASNSMEDLAELVAFAHAYYVRVYVTLNTLLYDEELPEVERMIWQLWKIGVDALIVQDMGITKLNLPPIPLHASTQTDNRSLEKVQFLEKAGFQQVVLARELSIEQIKKISSQTAVKLEAFIHGALCVSYSGQCYMSQVMAGRSANRGVCAQYCRLAYDLVDADGKVLAQQKHLLSLKDLYASSADLEALIDAGVSSFKIEGRLKETAYCKNITAWYRQQLDAIMARRDDLERTSSAAEQISFQPNPAKSFNRGFTDYLRHERSTKIYNFDTPKSMGEEMGFVRAQKLQHFVYLGKEPLHNGDGVSYFDEQGRFDGFRVNRVEGNQIYPADPHLRLKTGIKIYRTSDQAFLRQIEKPTAVRRIPITIKCRELPFGFALQMDDQEGHSASLVFENEKQPAVKSQRENIQGLMSKSAYPLYTVTDCSIEWTQDYFLPLSEWTAKRNQLYELFEKTRTIQFPRYEHKWEDSTFPYPTTSLSYLGNVLNRKAESFYRQHGVEEISPALETKGLDAKAVAEKSDGRLVLMRCKHCLRYAMNACPKQSDHQSVQEPLFLRYKEDLFPLTFDCKSCEMLVTFR